MIGYNKVNFENLPSENTPISAENLDIMDQGIYDLDNAIEANPASVATTDLESIRIDDTIYKIAGGHELVNSSGSTMTQRSKMEFLDTHLTDDSANNTTKVQVIKEVTTAQFANETEQGLYRITDKPDSVINAEQVAYGSGNVKDVMDTQALTITYTQNNYVSSISACSAYKKNNTLYFNLNIGVSGSPTPDFVEIGRIANWTAPKQLQMQVVGQSSSFTMVTVNVTTSGVIQLYFPMTIGSTTNFRQNSSQVLI